MFREVCCVARKDLIIIVYIFTKINHIKQLINNKQYSGVRV